MSQQKLAKEQVETQYQLHAAGVRRFLLGVLRDPDLAEEVLQQAFVQLMEKGHQADAETMKGWIYKVAFNLATAMRRREQIDTRAKMVLLPVAPKDHGATDDAVAELESLRLAQDAIADLPEEQREVLHLRFVEAHTFSQIAKKMGVPLGTALTRMRLALEKLRRKLS